MVTSNHWMESSNRRRVKWKRSRKILKDKLYFVINYEDWYICWLEREIPLHTHTHIYGQYDVMCYAYMYVYNGVIWFVYIWIHTTMRDFVLHGLWNETEWLCVYFITMVVISRFFCVLRRKSKLLFFYLVCSGIRLVKKSTGYLWLNSFCNEFQCHYLVSTTHIFQSIFSFIVTKHIQ